MKYNNEIFIVMDSKSQNEGFARIVVAAFVSVLDPTINEINDIKIAVSEAVTNSIIHGYEGTEGKVYLNCYIKNDVVTIEIFDDGIGIENLDEARTPLFTSKPDMERSGMGFTVMESFMDSCIIHSEKGVGTKITMSKRISVKE
jgi:stage II sporulation protein AB (anti-sigma F factor)